MKLIVEIEYAKAEMARDISPSDVLLALQNFCIHKIIAVSEIRPTPVAADLPNAPACDCGAWAYATHKKWCAHNTASR